MIPSGLFYFVPHQIHQIVFAHQVCYVKTHLAGKYAKTGQLLIIYNNKIIIFVQKLDHESTTTLIQETVFPKLQQEVINPCFGCHNQTFVWPIKIFFHQHSSCIFVTYFPPINYENLIDYEVFFGSIYLSTIYKCRLQSWLYKVNIVECKN